MRCLECYETDWAYHPKGSLGNEMINDMFQKKVSTDSLSITVTQQAFSGSKLRVVCKLSWCTVHDSAVENLDNPLHPIKHNKHQFPPRCQSYRCFLLRNWSTIYTWLASASNEGGSTWEGWGGGVTSERFDPLLDKINSSHHHNKFHENW